MPNTTLDTVPRVAAPPRPARPGRSLLPRPLVPLLPSRWHARASATVPPLVALVLGWLLVALRAPGGLGAAFDPRIYDHRDAGHYLGIAAHGYQLSTHCGVKSYAGGIAPLCGNVTWFPGYPALVRAVSLTGLGLATAALLVAWAAWYAALLLVWRLVRPDDGTRGAVLRAWGCLLLAAVFPGQVYFAALFPISLVVAAGFGCVLWATRSPRPWAAALAGFVAGASYLPSVAIVAGLATVVLVRRGGRRTAVACVAGIGGLVAGVLAVLVYARLTVGRFDAYFATERVVYGVGMHDPFPIVAARFREVLPLPAATAARVTAEQTLLVAAILLLAAAAIALRRGRGMTASDIACAVGGAVAWMIPYVSGGSLSIYRSEALVIVAIPLLRRLPAWTLVVPIAAATWVAWQMAPLFFSGVLV
jgi:hypothetical protein